MSAFFWTKISQVSQPIWLGDNADLPDKDQGRIVPALVAMRVFSWKLGLTVVACFVATLTVVMILHGVLKNRPRGFYLNRPSYLISFDS